LKKKKKLKTCTNYDYRIKAGVQISM